MRETFPGWPEVTETREPEWSDFDDLMTTFFCGLWKPKPVPNENLTKKGKQLKQLLETAEELKEWKQLRSVTVRDEISSAIGAIAIGKLIEIPEPEDGDGDWDSDESPFGDMSDDEVRSALRAACQQAQEEVDAYDDAVGMVQGHAPGEHEKISPEDRLKLAHALKDNANLRRLAKLVGRFRLIAESVYRNKVQYVREEIADITLGDQLEDMLPSEYLKLAAPELEVIFFLDFLQHSLQQWEYRGREKIGKGAIVIEIDLSGSMSYKLTGPDVFGLGPIRRIDWALATAMALSVIAAKEERDLHIGLFDTRIIQSHTFPKGKLDVEKILEIASFEFGGGTAYGPPLEDALGVLQLRPELQDADLVFVSDGECWIDQTTLREYDQQKEALAFRTLGVLCGHRSDAALDAICDIVIPVSKLTEGSKALDEVFAI
jgi:uncharacterized protein with von Willebrand factor type A (vWA) domain